MPVRTNVDLRFQNQVYRVDTISTFDFRGNLTIRGPEGEVLPPGSDTYEVLAKRAWSIKQVLGATEDGSQLDRDLGRFEEAFTERAEGDAANITDSLQNPFEANLPIFTGDAATGQFSRANYIVALAEEGFEENSENLKDLWYADMAQRASQARQQLDVIDQELEGLLEPGEPIQVGGDNDPIRALQEELAFVAIHPRWFRAGDTFIQRDVPNSTLETVVETLAEAPPQVQVGSALLAATSSPVSGPAAVIGGVLTGSGLVDAGLDNASLRERVEVLDNGLPRFFEAMRDDLSIYTVGLQMGGATTPETFDAMIRQGETPVDTFQESDPLADIAETVLNGEQVAPRDPLILTELNAFGGPPSFAHFDGVDESSAFFDLDGDGARENVAWPGLPPGAESGEDIRSLFVGLDRNDNGRIDGVTELLGGEGESGFAALREAHFDPETPELGGAARFSREDGVGGSAPQLTADVELPEGAFTVSAVVKLNNSIGSTGNSAIADFGSGLGDDPWFGIADGELALRKGGEVIAATDPADASVDLEPGQPHHVAVAFDGDRVRLFVNGEMVGDFDTSASFGGNGLKMGTGAGVGESRVNGRHAELPLSGVLDELRVWNRAFDPTGAADPSNLSQRGLVASFPFDDLLTDNAVGSADAIREGDVEIVDAGLQPGADFTIDSGDAIYDDLLLWLDQNRDGISTRDEVAGLAPASASEGFVESLSLAASRIAPTDTEPGRQNVTVTQLATAELTNGNTLGLVDAQLAADDINTIPDDIADTFANPEAPAELRSVGTLPPLAAAAVEDSELDQQLDALAGDLAAAGTWRSSTAEILQRWAGAGGDGAAIGTEQARLDTLEAVTGTTFDSSDSTGLSELFISDAWQQTLDTLGQTIALQLFGEGLFDRVTYAPRLNEVFVEGQVSPAFDALKAADPTDPGTDAADRWWSNAIALLRAGHEAGAKAADLDTTLQEAAAETGTSTSLNQLESGRFGTRGDDTLLGTRARDMLTGGAGGDRLLGAEGNDFISGGAGADLLRGSTGDDELIGGDGNDRLAGGFGADVLTGGSGSDTFEIGQPAPPDDASVEATTTVITDFEPSIDHIALDTLGISSEQTFLSLLEEGRDGATFEFTELGSFGPVSIRTVFQGESVDSIREASIETATARAAVSRIGTSNSDTFWGGAGPADINGEGGPDLLFGGGDADVLNGGKGDDTLEGGTGGDTLNGGPGDDRIIGGAGDDLLKGGAGNDTLTGGEGDDVAIFTGLETSYSISHDHNGVTVQGPDGQNLLSDVEQLKFDNTITTDFAPPVARDDAVSVQNDTSVTIDILSNDIEPDGDALRIQDPGDPANGDVEITDGGELRYTPDSGFTGKDSFTYTVSDGNRGTDTAEVSVTVEGTAPPSRQTPQATVFLRDGGGISLADPAEVFGRSGGSERVFIADGTLGVELDANIERLDLEGKQVANIAFQVTGDGLELVQAGEPIATIPSLNQGMELRFADGNFAVQQTGAQTFTVTGASGQATVGPDGITGQANAGGGMATPPPTSGASVQANAFVEAGAAFTVAQPTAVFGRGSGDERVNVPGDTAGVSLDANIERLDVDRPLSALTFAVTDDGLALQSGGQSVVTMPSLNQALDLRLAGGDATIQQVGAQSFKLAGGGGGTVTIGPESTRSAKDIILGDDTASGVGLQGVDDTTLGDGLG